MTIQYVQPQDSGYPPSLRENLLTRPKLACLGNLDLLQQPAIEICGARKATPNGINCARQIASRAVKQGFVVISGHAWGVDSHAHQSALKNGGSTILVLAEGIHRFSLRSELRSLVNYDKNTLVISQWADSAEWSTPGAMGRNQLMVLMSKAVFAIEAKHGRGGTWASANSCLKAGVPLYVARQQEDPPGEAEHVLTLKGATLYENGAPQNSGVWESLVH